MCWNKWWLKECKHFLSVPFIYAPIIAFIIFDIFLEIYNRVCFPLYWLKVIDRKKYIKFDRHKLDYISPLQKFNCTYCSYANWLVHYASVILWETEKYWCGIKNKNEDWFMHPYHHKDFLSYWDREAFVEKYPEESGEKECKLLKS